MKYIGIIIIALGMILSSCRHDDEPPTEVNLSIEKQFRPNVIVFQKSDQEFYDKIKPLSTGDFVVNSTDELPDDPMGFSDAYKNINFRSYTLLIRYTLYRWDFESYSNRFIRNRKENRYEWNINLGVAEIPEDDSIETLYFTRFAILVRKLPLDANILTWISLSALNWNWDDENENQEEK